MVELFFAESHFATVIISCLMSVFVENWNLFEMPVHVTSKLPCWSLSLPMKIMIMLEGKSQLTSSRCS